MTTLTAKFSSIDLKNLSPKTRARKKQSAIFNQTTIANSMSNTPESSGKRKKDKDKKSKNKRQNSKKVVISEPNSKSVSRAASKLNSNRESLDGIPEADPD